MKKIKLAALVSSAFFISSVNAATTVDGGTVNFVGSIVNAACSVSSDTQNQTVELGQVRSAQLSAAGDKSTSVGFNIVLEDCDTTVSSNASISFIGQTNGTSTQLALTGSTSSDAKNVAIEVLDSSGTNVTFDDNTSFSTKVALYDGRNTLPFQAYYVATGASTAGQANAQATFKVQYD